MSERNTFYSLILKRIDALRLFVQTGDTRSLKSCDLKIKEYLLILRFAMYNAFMIADQAKTNCFGLYFLFFILIYWVQIYFTICNDNKIDVLSSVSHATVINELDVHRRRWRADVMGCITVGLSVKGRTFWSSIYKCSPLQRQSTHAQLGYFSTLTLHRRNERKTINWYLTE